MIILVCCTRNFMLQNYIAFPIPFVYKLRGYVPKLQILLKRVNIYTELPGNTLVK
mgnify:CR=1 FL=1